MKRIEIPAITQNIVDFVACDICGAKISHGCYEVDEVEVRHKTGSSYPEGGSGTEVTVDMCGKCFDEKLVLWLRSIGAAPRVEEWEW
ncbi:MAG: hypothetical protein V1792_23415 [Pseudomonadota bacterium]